VEAEVVIARRFQARCCCAETVKKAGLFCKDRHHEPHYPIEPSWLRLILSELHQGPQNYFATASG
jgi:hypothetical protein